MALGNGIVLVVKDFNALHVTVKIHALKKNVKLIAGGKNVVNHVTLHRMYEVYFKTFFTEV